MCLQHAEFGKKLLGDSQKKTKKYEQLVQEINNLEEKLSDLSDENYVIKRSHLKTCYMMEKQ